MSKISKLSSAFKILWEAFNILSNNWRSLLPIMLINLLFSTIFLLLNYLSIFPIFTDFTVRFASLSILGTKSSQYAGILSTMRKDLREITTIGAIYLVSFFIVSSFIKMTIIHITSMAYSEKKKTPQELFSIIKNTWKEPMLTQLFATIVNILVGFSLSFLVLAFIMVSIGSFVYTTTGIILANLSVLLCLYVALICSLGIVVSVVEEGCYGIAAIERSVVLTKGRRQTGILIIFVINVGVGIINTTFNFSMLYASSKIFILVIGFGYVAMLAIMTVLIQVVNTVIYYECKGSGNGLHEMEGGLGYASMTKEVYASIP